MRTPTILAFAFLIAACPPVGPVSPHQDASDAQAPQDAALELDGGTVDPGDAGSPWASCPAQKPDIAVGAACGRMRALACPLGQPTPRLRETCECLLARLGALHEVNLDLACLAGAQSCRDVAGCNR